MVGFGMMKNAKTKAYRKSCKFSPFNAKGVTKAPTGPSSSLAGDPVSLNHYKHHILEKCYRLGTYLAF